MMKPLSELIPETYQEVGFDAWSDAVEYNPDKIYKAPERGIVKGSGESYVIYRNSDNSIFSINVYSSTSSHYYMAPYKI